MMGQRSVQRDLWDVPSPAPSLLMGVLLLKEATDVSDREAIERLRFDTHWQFALQLPIDFPGFPHT